MAQQQPEATRHDDPSVNAVIAFAKTFGMTPLWSIDGPKVTDVQAVHAYLWPATSQTVLFLRTGHFVGTDWRGAWEVYVPPTRSISIRDTEASLRHLASSRAANDLLIEALKAWPQLDLDQSQATDAQLEINGGDMVEWFSEWHARLKKLMGARR